MMILLTAMPIMSLTDGLKFVWERSRA